MCNIINFVSLTLNLSAMYYTYIYPSFIGDICIVADESVLLSVSFCDDIVVMNEGFIMQIGKPQEVYDAPTSLFVAKFLGNPPINVFKGRILNKEVYIGQDAIMPFEAFDQEVYVGIRPEGFIIDKDGPIHGEFVREEVMGKDKSVIFRHQDFEGENVRAIVPSEAAVEVVDDHINFALKKRKVFVFAKESGKIINPERS